MSERMRERSHTDFIAPSKPTPLEPLIASSVWGIIRSSYYIIIILLESHIIM